MSESAEIVNLPLPPQCPHCKYFLPGTVRDTGGKCRISMTEIGKERQDYDDDQSCGPEARWFKPRAEGDEPVAELDESEPEPEPAPVRRRISLSFGLFMFLAGVLSAVFVLGGLK